MIGRWFSQWPCKFDYHKYPNRSWEITVEELDAGVLFCRRENCLHVAEADVHLLKECYELVEAEHGYVRLA